MWRRALEHPIIRLFCGAVCVLAPVFAIHLGVRLLSIPESAAKPISTMGSVVLGLLGYILYVHRFEARPATELGVQGATRELLAGIALGALLFSLTILVLTLLNAFRITGYGKPSSMLGPLGIAVMAGVLEELLFRGLVFRLFEKALGTWLALGISALLFGLAHLSSPNPTARGIMSIVVEAGVLLAAAFVFTRRLWLPIGIHMAWNFTQGGVFGIAVSGTPSTGWLQGTLSGPDWLSGGAFGAEASIVAIALSLAAAATLLVLAARRGNLLNRRTLATN